MSWYVRSIGIRYLCGSLRLREPNELVKKHRLRDKVCVYCATKPAENEDHVFARQFFLESRRANLPKVPACLACNNEKSKLELYLVSVLPFGGLNIDAH